MVVGKATNAPCAENLSDQQKSVIESLKSFESYLTGINSLFKEKLQKLEEAQAKVDKEKSGVTPPGDVQKRVSKKKGA